MACPRTHFHSFLIYEMVMPNEDHNGFFDGIKYQIWVEEIKHER